MSLSIAAKKIRFLVEYKNITSSAFADYIDIQRSSISHILSGRNKPSIDIIRKILRAYPDINPNWLLFDDEEQMLLASPDFKPDLDENNSPSTLDNSTEEEANDEEQENVNPIEETETTILESEPSIPMSALASKKDKKIERIIIFYSDKTMESYEAN